jgi:dihydroneopterin aldolase
MGILLRREQKKRIVNGKTEISEVRVDFLSADAVVANAAALRPVTATIRQNRDARTPVVYFFFLPFCRPGFSVYFGRNSSKTDITMDSNMSKLRSSLARLTVAGAAFYAYHGVKAEERDLGGKYEVDLDLYYDSKQAVISDNISDAVNYEEALYRVSEVINNDDHYELVETLAYDILRALMNRFPPLMEATVRIRKYYAPVRHVISHIEVEQTLIREDQGALIRDDIQ